ncbi:interleukin-17 receptor E isoform X2 [Lissotriton helveticus]
MGRALGALLTLLCFSLGGAHAVEYITDAPRLTANFVRTLWSSFPRVKLHRNLLPGPTVSPPELSLSTVPLCPPRKVCRPCIRLGISMNTSGVPRLQGFQVHFLDTSSNHSREFLILNKNRTSVPETWKVEYDCFDADVGKNVSVSVATVPDYNVGVLRHHVLRKEDSGPPFSYEFDETKRQITVSVPPGPRLKARLCHQELVVCEELRNRSLQEIKPSSSLTAVLQYEYLLPCLCIEVYYLKPNIRRAKKCPFAHNPKAYGADLWNAATFKGHRSATRDQVLMDYTSPCPERPAVSLCHKPKDLMTDVCEDLPNSRASESVLDATVVYSIDSVDRNPRLCFKFSLGASSHVECPHTGDPDWTVAAKVQLFHTVLTFRYSLNASASFGATTCRKSQDGQCRQTGPVYTIFSANSLSPEKMELILPFQFLESCVLVWRSDVRFAAREVICPDISRRRIGLIAVGLLAGVLLTIVLVLLNYLKIQKAKKAPLWRRTILLVYSPDSEQYKIAICAFADFLRTSLGCNVILDLWEVGRVAQMGVLPWLYSKRELVEREKGKVIFVWTHYSSKVYEVWRSQTTSSSYRGDPHNLFGAAMSCLQRDMKELTSKEKLRDYILVYFDGLCEKQDIPQSLMRIPRYRLFKDLHGLVNELQCTAQSGSCWIRAVAKFVVRKLVKSEKSASLQGRLELCRLQQKCSNGWPKEMPQTKVETSIY